MDVSVTLADVEEVKLVLSRLLPTVKSSHRVEAMARGFGWQTNAALRAALTREQMLRSIDGQAFAEYLAAHGFPNISQDMLIEAVVCCRLPERTAIRAVMNHEPALTISGFGVHRDSRKTREERQHEFREARAGLLTPEGINQFFRAREYLSYYPIRHTINPTAFSYGLKHRAENFHRDQGQQDYYVSNGALIAAAIHRGCNYRASGPNAYFNLGSKQDHPQPDANTLGRFVAARERKGRSLPQREIAWRNLMIAGINAGKAQGLFGLDPDDNRWTGSNATYRFSFAGMPAIACVGDARFGELIFHIAAKPTPDAEEWILACNAFFDARRRICCWLARTPERQMAPNERRPHLCHPSQPPRNHREHPRRTRWLPP